MKKCIIHIKLSNTPILWEGKTKNIANSSRLDNWTKSLGVVKVEAFSHNTSLVSRNWAIRIFLNSKNPLATNEILLRVRRNKLPSFILDKSIKLLRHCLSLIGNIQCLWDTSRSNKRIRWKKGRKKKVLRFENIVLSLCNHEYE